MKLVEYVNREVGPKAADCLKLSPKASSVTTGACESLMAAVDYFCACLYSANRRSYLAHQSVNLICLCASDAPKAAKYTVMDDVRDGLASLVTALVVKSRMTLVAMLLMSGLWPRLVNEHITDGAEDEFCRNTGHKWTL